MPNPPYYVVSGARSEDMHPWVVLENLPDGHGTKEPSLWYAYLSQLFLNWRKRDSHFISAAVREIQLSPDGQQLLGVTFSGELLVWKTQEVAMFHKQPALTADDLQQLFEVEEDGVVATVPPLRRACWWSNEEVVLSLEDGKTLIVSLHDKEPRSDMMTNFHENLELLPQSQGLFLLDSSLHYGRLRFRKDGSFLWKVLERLEEDQDAGSQEAPASMLSISAVLSIVIQPIRYLTDTFLWNFDKDSHLSQYQTVIIPIRSFTLLYMRETNPKDLFWHHIRSQQYDDALELAAMHDLDTDEVYKARWLESIVTLETIQEYLDPIHDFEWKLNYCLTRITDSDETQRLVYEYGISMTNILPELLDDDVPVGGLDTNWNERLKDVELSEVHMNMIFYRIQYLQLQDRLNSFVTIHEQDSPSLLHGPPFTKSFGSFRDVVLAEQAVEYARLAKFGALDILTRNHHADVYPYRFAVLDNLCEIASPRAYETFLPIVQAGHEILPPIKAVRKMDWAECSVILSQVDGAEKTFPSLDHWISQLEPVG